MVQIYCLRWPERIAAKHPAYFKGKTEPPIELITSNFQALFVAIRESLTSAMGVLYEVGYHPNSFNVTKWAYEEMNFNNNMSCGSNSINVRSCVYEVSSQTSSNFLLSMKKLFLGRDLH